jgi:hypothetical protein
MPERDGYELLDWTRSFPRFARRRHDRLRRNHRIERARDAGFAALSPNQWKQAPWSKPSRHWWDGESEERLSLCSRGFNGSQFTLSPAYFHLPLPNSLSELGKRKSESLKETSTCLFLSSNHVFRASVYAD